jgi:hypothetical protein
MNAGKVIQIIDPKDTYLNIRNITTKVVNAIKPNHGEIASNVPPAQDTPFPPVFVFALTKFPCVLNKVTKYCIGQQ